MKILLDTHILLWALADDDKLPDKAKKLIENEDNELFYSIISLWEIELKRLAHPDKMKGNSKIVADFCKIGGVEQLDMKNEHIYNLENLKRDENLPPHKDPFDRLLICQAATENMMLVTHDSLIGGYNEPCIMVV